MVIWIVFTAMDHRAHLGRSPWRGARQPLRMSKNGPSLHLTGTSLNAASRQLKPELVRLI